MIQTQVRPYYRNKVNQVQLIKCAQAVLDYEGKSGNATIVVTGNQEIQALSISPTDTWMHLPMFYPSVMAPVDPDTGEYLPGRYSHLIDES